MGNSEQIERIAVPEEWHGVRIDQGLRLLAPESGLRQRQQWCASGRVRQNGRTERKGGRLEAGATLELLPEPLPSKPQPASGVRVVSVVNALAAVFKPGNVHCEAQSHNPEPSVESVLPNLFPRQRPRLLNRLDYPTSGLVLVALSQGAFDQYQIWQDEGRVRKTYWAEIHGEWTGPELLKWRIETAKRRRVAVVFEPDPDPLRWTHVRALYRIAPGRTRVEVVIAKGRRHHIRAHLAAAGTPIQGDSLYGEDSPSAQLFLHHLRVHMPGFTAETPPPWSENAAAR